MLVLALSFAAAGSEVVVDPDDLPALPLQVQDEARWQAVDLHAVELSRGTLVAGLASLGVGAMGAGVLAVGFATGSDVVTEPIGGTLVFVGAVGAAVTPPVLLATSMRSHRALRERGVFASSMPATIGWTLIGTGILFTPIFLRAPYTIPFYYAGIVAGGLGQMQLNERVRAEAGLPRGGELFRGVAVLPEPRGLRLVGSF